MLNMEVLNNLDEYIRVKQYRLVNAVVVYENGGLIFERYYNGFNEQSRNNLKSVWKSILSLTLGICLDKGYVKNLDEPICKYLPEFDKNEDPYHKYITIRHLLTMSSGIHFVGGIHYHCPMLEQMMRSSNWIAHIADVAVTSVPGAKFQYKEWDVILLSALIGKACGGSAWDICYENLYKPLDIKSGKWPQSKCGVDYTILKNEKDSDLSAKDLAKIGLLLQNDGIWEGKRLLQSDYINASVLPSSTNPGYGFLWWLSDKGFHGRGFGGQELNIYADKKTVAVVQATPTSSSKSYGDICERMFQLR